MKYKKVVLDNGLRLVTCRMPHTRSVSVVYFVMTGSCYEKEREAGISHFIEHMCFKGTKKRPEARQISEAIEGVGGILNGGTDRETTTYWCKMASEHFELAVDVLTDLLRNPLFRAEDVEKERGVIIEEINMSMDSPQQRVCMLYDAMMWPGRPLGRDVAGSRETVTSITGQAMQEYMERNYGAGNILVSVAGDIKSGEVEDVINLAMGGHPWGRRPRFIKSKSGQAEARSCFERRKTEQVNLILGVEGLSMFDPDRFKVDLLSMLLGEGMSSRLFTEIREKQGLAYDIHSYVEHHRDTGVFSVQAALEPRNTEKAVAAILGELAAVIKDISEEELSKAREMARGRLLLSMENSRNVAGWYGAQEALTGKILTVDDVMDIVGNITQEDISRVAGNIFREAKLNLAAVGPSGSAQKFKKMLKL
jgi:predicted Zn-dependent peptidase